MGQVRKIGDIYYIEFQARGLMYSQVAGTSEKKAFELLKDIEGKIAQGESLTIVREIELSIFFEKFLIYAKEKFSAKSINRFSSAWMHFLGFLRDNKGNVQRLSQVTPSVIESYKTFLVKTTRPKIVNLTILLMREILEYGIRIGFINDNPSLHVNLLKVSTLGKRIDGRSKVAKDLLARNVSLEKLNSILKLKDVAQIIYWSDFIPLKREDVYL